MSITKACKELGYGKCSFFKVRNSKIKQEQNAQQVEGFILEKVRAIREEMPKLGGKKMYFLINKDGERKRYKFGEKRFFKVLKAHNLLIKKRKNELSLLIVSLGVGNILT